MSNARDRQEGGNHYKDMDIQPWDALACWLTDEQLTGYFLGSALAYQARFNATGEGKGGLLDLKKARHYLDALIEYLEPPVTTEMYALAPKAPEGWIRWTWSQSAPNPALPVGTQIKIRFACESFKEAESRQPGSAGGYVWSARFDDPSRITHYMIVEA